MRYVCLICDYDGTIAAAGRVAQSTREALERVRKTGRRLVLATGRELNDLLDAFPEAAIFDRIVAENGGLLYRPSTGERRALASAPPRNFVEELVRRGVAPLSIGETIVSTRSPQETEVLSVIRDLGLELHLTFNKGAVMVLPSGVNKGTGVRIALEDLGISPHNAAGIGDAENDHAFLELCEFSAAVQNAIPGLKERADLVTASVDSGGAQEFIEHLIENDLADFNGRLERHCMTIGTGSDSGTFALSAYGSRLLVAGPSGSGKSTFISLLVEKLVEQRYQICLIDPEGDYDQLESFVSLGGANQKPEVPAILDILDKHSRSVTVNLLGVPLEDRPSFFQDILLRLQELHAKTGRPHWIIVDEAHQQFSEPVEFAGLASPKGLETFALVTVYPQHVPPGVLKAVNALVLVGPGARELAKQFGETASLSLDLTAPELEGPPGTVVVWQFARGLPPARVKLQPTSQDRRRHRQKYAAGELGEDKSFYFRGSKLEMNLRAQNLKIFAQMAEGIDEATWNHHLRAHDYSRWIRESVKDEALANEVGAIEKNEILSPSASRKRILEAIRKMYTAPA